MSGQAPPANVTTGTATGTRRGLVAVLVDEQAPYQQSMVESIAEALDRAGFATLCVTGRELAPPDRFHQSFSVCNQIYTLAQRATLAGVICLSGALGRRVESGELRAFLARFTVPVVSIGEPVPGVRSVVVREHDAMRALMRHLLVDDERRRFAFVRGFADDVYTQMREAVFRTELQRHGRTWPEACCIEGDYDAFTTYRAVTDLLVRHPDTDTIVAANDTMALSAARAVSASGRRVPHEVAITGFDDTPEATTHTPPLTTVRQPIGRMAERAVEILLQPPCDDGTGRARTVFEVDAELVVRGSTQAPEPDASPRRRIDADGMADAMHAALAGLQPPGHIDLDAIAHALWRTLDSDGDELDRCLCALPVPRADDDELHWWNNLCAGIESLATAALAQRGRTRIGNTVIAALSSLRGRIWTAGTEREFAERRAQGIRADMQLEISSCTTPEQIVATLGRWMSHLQPRRAFLVRFAAPCTEPPERATLLQVYLDGVAQPGRPLDFATRLLLPDPLAVELERGTLLLNPLYAGDMLYGYLMTDPLGIPVSCIDSAAHSIGNAMRNRHLIDALEAQAQALNATNAELAHLANYDALTGLPNRRQFEQHLDAACARADGPPFALCFLDLDGFKQVNDTLGHKAGDLLLIEVARRVQHTLAADSVRPAFTARLGGDEFVMVLAGLDDTCELQRIAGSILACLARPYDLQDQSARLSASIGSALFPSQGARAADLLRRADEAMYTAKSDGKNRFCLYAATEDEHEDEDEDRQGPRRVESLERALGDGSLRLHLQPRMALADGRVQAIEGLMRWFTGPQADAATVAEPEHFVPLAEQAGLIEPLELLALDQACAIARHRLEEGAPLPVSINLSSVNWAHGRIVGDIGRALERHGLPGRLLEIELDAQALITDHADDAGRWQALGEIGVSLTIDGFGARACSIARLARLPARRVKLDRALLHGIDERNEPTTAAVRAYRAAVALAVSLGLRTVAMGVENEAQRRMVTELGCDEAQGHLYARASAASEDSGAAGATPPLRPPSRFAA